MSGTTQRKHRDTCMRALLHTYVRKNRQTVRVTVSIKELREILALAMWTVAKKKIVSEPATLVTNQTVRENSFNFTTKRSI